MSHTSQRQLNAKNNIMSVDQYLQNKRKRTEFTFCILPNGERYYKKSGVHFSIAEIDRTYPIPASLLTRHNFDTRNKWMY